MDLKAIDQNLKNAERKAMQLQKQIDAHGDTNQEVRNKTNYLKKTR